MQYRYITILDFMYKLHACAQTHESNSLSELKVNCFSIELKLDSFTTPNLYIIQKNLKNKGSFYLTMDWAYHCTLENIAIMQKVLHWTHTHKSIHTQEESFISLVVHSSWVTIQALFPNIPFQELKIDVRWRSAFTAGMEVQHKWILRAQKDSQTKLSKLSFGCSFHHKYNSTTKSRVHKAGVTK